MSGSTARSSAPTVRTIASTGYISLRAIADVKTPRYTSVAYAVNNEEVASWNTGVNSEWFNTLVSEMHDGAAGEDVQRARRCARTYARTNVLVSDCHHGAGSALSAAAEPEC